MQLPFIVALSILVLSVTVTSKTPIAPDEYAIYTTLLGTVFKEEKESYRNISYPVIYSLTGTDENLHLDEGRRYRGLASDFLAKNKTSASLEQKLPLKRYFLVEQKEIDDLFTKAREEIKAIEEQAKSQNAVVTIISANYWSPFYEKYPEAYGLFRLSRVGFTKNKEFAAAQIIQETSLTGFSRTFILRKLRKGWRIISWQGSSSIS